MIVYESDKVNLVSIVLKDPGGTVKKLIFPAKTDLKNN